MQNMRKCIFDQLLLNNRHMDWNLFHYPEDKITYEIKQHVPNKVWHSIRMEVMNKIRFSFNYQV